MVNHGWLEEGQLLRDAAKLRHIPGVIVQGRYDCCTPPGRAGKLKQAWPEVELNIVPDAGHHVQRARESRRAGPRHRQFAERREGS